MARSLEEKYNEALQKQARLHEQVVDLRRELVLVHRDRRRNETASRNTFEKLLGTVSYAIAHLIDAGDTEAAEKLSGWLDEMRETMQPVANVKDLVGLLDDWARALPYTDANTLSALYLRTRMTIGSLTGRTTQ